MTVNNIINKILTKILHHEDRGLQTRALCGNMLGMQGLS